MSRNVLFALALSLAFSGFPAWAQDEDVRGAPPDGEAPAVEQGEAAMAAKDLQDVCAPPASLEKSAKDAAAKICNAYLSGISDGLFMLGALQQQGARICLPDDGPVSPDEAKSELEDYLADHPEAIDRSAGVAVAFALIVAHPCE